MNPADNIFAGALLLTGRGAVELGGGASTMILGARDGREKIALVVPTHFDEQTNYLRYIQALTLSLYAGVDNLYEMRDIFISDVKEITPNTPRPSEDPNAQNALSVSRIDVDTLSQDIWVQRYNLDDQGKPTFHPVELSSEPVVDLSRSLTTETIQRWREAGKPQISPAAIEHSRLAIGLLGRVDGADPIEGVSNG